MALPVVRTGDVALDRFLDEVRRKLDSVTASSTKTVVRGNSGGSGSSGSSGLTAADRAQIDKLTRDIIDSRLAQELRGGVNTDGVRAEIDRLRTEIRSRLEQVKVEALAQFSSGVDYALMKEAQARIDGDVAAAQDVVDAIAQEVLDRNAAIQVETDNRISAINQEVSDRNTAIAAAAEAAHDELVVETTILSNAIFAESATRTKEIAANAESIIRTALAAESIYNDAQTTIATAKSDLTASFEYGIAAEVTARNLLAAQVNANTAAVLSEQTARATADAAIAEDVTVLFAETGENKALITSETTARTTADAALGSRIDALIVTTGEADAAIVSTQNVMASDIAANATSISTLTTRVGAAETAITNEAATRATAISTEASTRNALATRLLGDQTEATDISVLTSGLMFQERTARSTAVESLTQQITLLSAGAGEQFDWSNIWYFDAGIESWTGTGTPTATGGWLRPANSSTPAVTSPGSLAINGGQYTQVRLRIRKTGSPVWTGLLSWSGGSAAIDEPAFDGGIGLCTVNTGWTGTINQITVELSADQTATDYFEIDWVAVGRPSPGASSAQLYAEQLARANADGSLATDITNLSTKVDAGDATSLTAINTEATTRATKDSSQGSQINTMSAALGANIAAITSEATARSTKDDATASTLQTLSASMGDSLAGIKNEATVRTTADVATAGQVNTLSAGVGQAQAGVISEQTVRVTETKALAQAQSSLAASIGTTHAGLSSQGKVTADADNALAQGQLALYSSVGDARAGLISEQITRANKDSALSSQTVSLAATLGENTSALKVEQSTRATQDSAQANQITVLGAVTGDTVAGLKSEQSTRTTADSALSSQITTLTASTGDLAASVITTSNAVADLKTAQADTSTSLLATTRKLDESDEELAEATLRNALSADKTKTFLLGTMALAESKMTAYVDEGIEAEANSRLTLAAVVDGVQSGLITEQTARSTQDAALASQVVTLSASIGDSAASIKTEQSVRASETAATASLIDTMYAAVGENSATIKTVQNIQVDAASAAASKLETMSVAVGDSQSAIVDEKKVRATETAATASRINGLDVALGNSLASIITEQVARVTSDSAVAQQIFTLLAQTATAMASILEVSKVSTTADSALASTTTTHLASLDGQVSAVQAESKASADKIEGLEAKYTVKVTAGGHVAGFGLASTSNAAGVGTSSFIVQADKFGIVSTDGTTSKVPFSVNTATGKVVFQSDVAIDGNLLVTGTIKNSHISTAEADRITADRIDSRGLSIKDAEGNIILAAGTALSTANISGLGSLATKNTVSAASDVTGFGSLATKNTVSAASDVTGLGSLATKSAVAWGSEVSGRPSNVSALTGSEQIQNSLISIQESAGTLTLTGGAGGTVANVVTGNNKITSGNVSTYISTAAIGEAYIGDLSASKITTGTLSADRIGAGTISADKLAADFVLAKRVSVDSTVASDEGITVFGSSLVKTAILGNNTSSANNADGSTDAGKTRAGVVGHVTSNNYSAFGALVGLAGIVNHSHAVPSLLKPTAGVYGNTSGGLANQTAGVYGECSAGVTGAAGQFTNRSDSGYAMCIEGVATGASGSTAANNARIIWNGRTISAPVSGGTAFLKQDGSWGTPSTGASVGSPIPSALGTAAAGTSTDAARADHVHAKPSVTDVVGYTPVQQGTGTGQLGNAVKIGWDGSSLLLQVDSTNFGVSWPISVSGNAGTATTADKLDGRGPTQWLRYVNTTTASKTFAGYMEVSANGTTAFIPLYV